MEHKLSLGQSNLKAPRMGIGAMVWGQPKGLARWTPARLAYGPSPGASEEEQALEVSLAAGVNLIDTAAMYSHGASEQRVGKLVRDKDVLVATKFPPGMFSRTGDVQQALEASLARLGRDYVDLFLENGCAGEVISASRLVPLARNRLNFGRWAARCAHSH